MADPAMDTVLARASIDGSVRKGCCACGNDHRLHEPVLMQQYVSPKVTKTDTAMDTVLARVYEHQRICVCGSDHRSTQQGLMGR